LSDWQPYLIATLVGLLVGIERERSHPGDHRLGVRTFLLISLLGAVAGGLANPWLAALLGAFALGLILISYYTQTRTQSPKVDRGLTTEFAAGVIFCLSYASHQSPALALIVGPFVALILFSKSNLHRFSHAIQPSELEAVLVLLVGLVLIINLVPDRAIDSWNIFNPRRFGFLVLTLAALEFASYLLAKLVGEKKGFLLAGFLGGFVSSTAVLFTSARRASSLRTSWRGLAGAVVAAQLAALLELLLIVALISPPLLKGLLPPIVGTLATGGLALGILAQSKGKVASGKPLRSPLDWRNVFRLSFTLAGILAAVSVTQRWIGDRGTFALSFLTGLFELHGVSLANATLLSQGDLSLAAARASTLLAVSASLSAKVALAWLLHRGTFSKALTLIFSALAGILGFLGWLT
jgi:uncharacterized membrane protein (DUF4010 family)